MSFIVEPDSLLMLFFSLDDLHSTTGSIVFADVGGVLLQKQSGLHVFGRVQVQQWQGTESTPSGLYW